MSGDLGISSIVASTDAREAPRSKGDYDFSLSRSTRFQALPAAREAPRLKGLAVLPGLLPLLPRPRGRPNGQKMSTTSPTTVPWSPGHTAKKTAPIENDCDVMTSAGSPRCHVESTRRRRDSHSAGPRGGRPSRAAGTGALSYKPYRRSRARYPAVSTMRSRSANETIRSATDALWPSRRIAARAACMAKMAARWRSDGMMTIR